MISEFYGTSLQSTSTLNFGKLNSESMCQPSSFAECVNRRYHEQKASKWVMLDDNKPEVTVLHVN